MKLTLEKKQQFVTWLESVGITNAHCHICESRNLAIMDDVVFLHTSTARQVYHAVGVICTRCKHIELFSAIESGVLDDRKESNDLSCAERTSDLLA